MKQIRNIIGLALISPLLFVSCTKNSNYTDIASASAKNTAMANPTANTALVNFTLETLYPPQNPFLLWNSGYITTNAIIFEGTHVNDGIFMSKYLTNITQTVQLAGATNLGNVSVPYDKFNDVSFLVSIAPVNQAHALFLSGSYEQMNNTTSLQKKVPVQIVIDDQEEIGSAWLSNGLVGQPGYRATLALRMDVLTNGITLNTLNKATMTNGVIVISASSNNDLYKIVINNLQTAITAQFSAAPVQTPAPIITTAVQRLNS